MEVSIKVVADDEKRKAENKGDSNLLEKTNTAVANPDWSSHEVTQLPAEVNESVRGTSD